MLDKHLFAQAKLARLALLLTIFFGVAIGGMLIIQAALLSAVIKRAFLDDALLADLIPYFMMLLVVIIMRVALNFGEAFTAKQIAIRVKRDLRQRLMAHVIVLGPSYMVAERSGEMVNTLTEGIEALEAYFRDYLPGLFNALFIPAIMLFIVFPIDLITGIILFVTAPLIPLFMALIGMLAGQVARQQYGAMSRMSAHFLDVLQGLTTLKLFNRSQRQVQTIQRITDDFRAATMGVLRIAFLSAFWLELMATISVALVAVEIGVRLLYGGIGFEQALFLLIIAPDYYAPLRALGAKFHAGTEGTAASKRIFAILETQPAVVVSENAQSISTIETIRFEDVSVSYGADRHALHDVSFEIRAGEKVAIVGASGAGKSTIANLLLGFIRPTQGRILVNGIDFTHIDLRAWRERVAWVSQTPYLFNTTIRENIGMGLTVDDDALQTAAKHAHAHDFIMTFPDGYDTVVGEKGSRLSGGQAQRIALARAFLRNAPLVILDEATANLDLASELAITEALKDLLEDKTALIIAHRLSTIFEADRILVLEQGRVIQFGAHEELMMQSGVYQQLVAAYVSK